MPRLTLSLFGSSGILLDAEPLTHLTSKTQALLYYLAVEAQQPHRRTFLAGLLWPEQPEETARNSLRQSLHQLHITLGDQFMQVTPQTVQFNLTSDYLLDVAQFTTLISECETHSHRSPETCRACMNRLQCATELYRGDLLTDFFLKDSVPFEEWALVEREQLRRLVMSALERLTDYHVRRGNYAQMEQAARQQIKIDSFHEPAYQELLRALAWKGQRNAALAQYESYRQQLEQEFGVEPSRAIKELCEQIRDEKLEKPRIPISSSLPLTLTHFIGREREIAQVQQLLEKNRMLTLTGAGGCGKTRLALEVARNLFEEFPDGVWFVELAALADGALVPHTIAATLGVREQPGSSWLDQVINHARARQLLIVLDNCEHVLNPCAEFVERFLRAAPQGQLLITSREMVGSAGEVVFRVPSLEIPPDNLALCQLAQIESVKLFVIRAQTVQPGFQLTDANAAAVVHICRQLDGIPLAIELAAARVKALSVEEIKQRLNDRFHLLTGGSRTALPRHQTLLATIEWSYQLLTAQERLLLNRLAVFVGGWTLAAAEEICADLALPREIMPEQFAHLVDKSLVTLDMSASRYHMLETIRQYAREKLSESGAIDEWQERHLIFFMKLAEEAELKLVGAEQRQWASQLDSEHENLRAALSWSSAAMSDNTETGLRLAAALWRYWHLRGYLTEGRECLAGVLKRATSQAPEATTARAKVLNAAGTLAYYQGDYASASALLEEGLANARKLNDQQDMAIALSSLGNVALSQGDYAKARSIYQESLALKHALGDRWGVARILSNLGLVARSVGELEQARALQEEGLDLFRELGEKNGVAYALNALGDIARDLGNLDTARSYLAESEKIYRELGNTWGLAYTLDSLADVAFSNGDYATASALYCKSLEFLRDEREMWGLAYSLESFAALETRYGRNDRSARLFGAAAALREAIGLPLPPIDQAEYERNVTALRTQMDEATFAAAWEEGRKMTLEQAVAFALADSPRA